MPMKRICAISSWISFLISTDILSGDYFSALRAMGFCTFCSPHSNDKMIHPDTMTRATLTIAAVAFLCLQRQTRHRSRLFHGAIVATITGSIWSVKIDPSPGDGCKRD
jgi:hypothetical protein